MIFFDGPASSLAKNQTPEFAGTFRDYRFFLLWGGRASEVRPAA
jgi:hypothetical protein